LGISCQTFRPSQPDREQKMRHSRTGTEDASQPDREQKMRHSRTGNRRCVTAGQGTEDACSHASAHSSCAHVQARHRAGIRYAPRKKSLPGICLGCALQARADSRQVGHDDLAAAKSRCDATQQARARAKLQYRFAVNQGRFLAENVRNCRRHAHALMLWCQTTWNTQKSRVCTSARTHEGTVPDGDSRVDRIPVFDILFAACLQAKTRARECARCPLAHEKCAHTPVYKYSKGSLDRHNKSLDRHNKSLDRHNKSLDRHNKSLDRHNKSLDRHNKSHWIDTSSHWIHTTSEVLALAAACGFVRERMPKCICTCACACMLAFTNVPLLCERLCTCMCSACTSTCAPTVTFQMSPPKLDTFACI
jgi:hypothetical protein